MGFEHNGQLDACVDAGLGGIAGATAAAARAGEQSIPALACRISPWSFGPSTRFTLRPLAKVIASSVNRPEVTTKPPVAPRAAITPYSSRTTSTPTLKARHCLH